MTHAPVTNFLLIRHAVHALGGDTIAGRMPGVHLSADGVTQAACLAERLAHVRVDAIYCSPLERTRETAAPLADRCAVPVQVRDGLQEIDYGDWTGRRLEELAGDERWTQWNRHRSGARVPNGESMVEVQLRIIAETERLRELHPQENVALVSHGDVIKAAVAHFLGVPLDLFQRIEISPASITVVQVAELGPWVLGVNNTTALEELPAL